MSKRKKLSATFEQIDRAYGVLDDALRSTGRLLPNNEDEIRQSESEIDVDGVSMPELLQDPMATLARGRDILNNGFSANRIQSESTSDEVWQHLSRAARNGQAISGRIQERMLKDRESATKKPKKA